METELIKRTRLEEEHSQRFEEAMSAKDYERALLHVKRLIQIRRYYPSYYFWLGDCYEDMGRITLAINNYKKAIKYDGRLYIIDGDFKEAVERRIKELETNRDDVKL